MELVKNVSKTIIDWFTENKDYKQNETGEARSRLLSASGGASDSPNERRDSLSECCKHQWDFCRRLCDSNENLDSDEEILVGGTSCGVLL